MAERSPRSNNFDPIARTVVDMFKREGFVFNTAKPAAPAAPAAPTENLRPEMDKLTGEVDELKQLVTRMSTTLDEHREHMSTRFDKQRQLIRMSFALVIAIVVGIQLTLYSIDAKVKCPEYCECITFTEASFKLVNMTAHLNYAALKYVYDNLS
jgi:hypothetical protein